MYQTAARQTSVSGRAFEVRRCRTTVEPKRLFCEHAERRSCLDAYEPAVVGKCGYETRRNSVGLPVCGSCSGPLLGGFLGVARRFGEGIETGCVAECGQLGGGL